MDKLKHRLEIDGLRAVAIIPVVFYHFGLGMPGGFVGVDVFFVISGYLITSLILSDLRSDRFSLRNFWERRMRRLLPAAFTVAIASLIAGWVLLAPNDLRDLGGSVMSQSVFASNFYFWQGSGYFAGPSDLKPMLHTWSLAVEEQFYLILPPLLILLWRTGFKLMWWVLGGIFAGSFLLSTVGVSRFPDATFFLLPTRMWELLAGSVLAMLGGFGISVRNRALSEILNWAGIAVILFAVLSYGKDTAFPGPAALLPCLGTMALIVGTGRSSSITSLLKLKPIVFIGLISYSWYLWHWPLVSFAKHAVGTASLSFSLSISLMIASFIMAVVSWRFIETPFRTKTLLSTSRSLLACSAACLAGIAALGLTLHLTDGAPGRFSESMRGYVTSTDDINPLREKTHNLGADHIREHGVPFLHPADEDIHATLATTASPLLRPPNTLERGAPELLVWGDSHGDSVMPAIRSLSAEHGIAAYGATQNLTIPFTGVYMDRRSEKLKNDCIEFNQAMIDFARSSGVKHVLLIARWSTYISPIDGEPRAEVTGGVLRGPEPRPEMYTTAYVEQVFKAGILRTVQELQEMGVQVWIMEEVPAMNESAPKALMNAVNSGLEPSEVGIPLVDHQKKAESAKRIFSRAYLHTQERGKPIEFLDPVPYLSDKDGFCRAGFDGRAVYYDSNHLSTHGAMRLTPMFETIVESILSERQEPSPAIRE